MTFYFIHDNLWKYLLIVFYIMFTLVRSIIKSNRFLAWDKEGQPNIVELAKDSTNNKLPPNFPIDKFLKKYGEWENAKKSDPSNTNPSAYTQHLFVELRDMHQEAGINKSPNLVNFGPEEDMVSFANYVQKVKAIRSQTAAAAGPVAAVAATAGPAESADIITFKASLIDTTFKLWDAVLSQGEVGKDGAGAVYFINLRDTSTTVRMMYFKKEGNNFVPTIPTTNTYDITDTTVDGKRVITLVAKKDAPALAAGAAPAALEVDRNAAKEKVKPLIGKVTLPEWYKLTIEDATNRIWLTGSSGRRYFTLGNPENKKNETQAWLQAWVWAMQRNIEATPAVGVSVGGQGGEVQAKWVKEAADLMKKFPGTRIYPNAEGNYPINESELSRDDKDVNIFTLPGFDWDGDTWFKTKKETMKKVPGALTVTGVQGITITGREEYPNIATYTLTFSTPLTIVNNNGRIVGSSKVVDMNVGKWSTTTVLVNGIPYNIGDIQNGDKVPFTVATEVMKAMEGRKTERRAEDQAKQKALGEAKKITESLKWTNVTIAIGDKTSKVTPRGVVADDGKTATAEIPLAHIDPKTGKQVAGFRSGNAELSDIEDTSIIIGTKWYTVSYNNAAKLLTVEEDEDVYNKYIVENGEKKNKSVLDAFEKARPGQINGCIKTCTNDAIKKALEAVNTNPSKENVIALQKAVYGEKEEKKQTGVLTEKVIQDTFDKSSKEKVKSAPQNMQEYTFEQPVSVFWMKIIKWSIAKEGVGDFNEFTGKATFTADDGATLSWEFNKWELIPGKVYTLSNSKWVFVGTISKDWDYITGELKKPDSTMAKFRDKRPV